MLLYYALVRSGEPGAGIHTPSLLVHGAGFGGYCLLIGYLLPTIPREGYVPFGLVGLVMAVHLMGVAHQLRSRHGERFDRLLRWVFVSSVAAGWTIGAVVHVPKGAIRYGSSFLAGGILINVFTEELEAPEETGIIPFTAGIALFALAAMLIRSLPRLSG